MGLADGDGGKKCPLTLNILNPDSSFMLKKIENLIFIYGTRTCVVNLVATFISNGKQDLRARQNYITQDWSRYQAKCYMMEGVLAQVLHRAGEVRLGIV